MKIGGDPGKRLGYTVGRPRWMVKDLRGTKDSKEGGLCHESE